MSVLPDAAGAGVVLWLMLAGACGAVLRLACDHWLPRGGILLANVAGSLVAGLVIGLQPSADATTLWVTGFCGALTTFSTVSTATADDVLRGRWGTAARTWALHLGLGALAVVLGLLSGSALSAA
ncbi:MULTISPECIES: CrcB family protein [Micrococcaceae]|uniref:fluoride efflux transporter FluC n=1 Tax=Micrococcaceae TaxID=1268 RepID=UPI0017E8DB56|nr:CrcB family protein [Citricoccus sp.]MBB5748326.1 CrcB protein [Micrococcus sp. TA1]HRO29482.1 CrcB family protein [Citricoccus sp.]HRO94656.1 CrcB family protein [Citricoccus sp.]